MSLDCRCRFFRRLVTRYQHSRILDKLRGLKSETPEGEDRDEGGHGENQEGQGSQEAKTIEGTHGNEGVREGGDTTDQR